MLHHLSRQADFIVTAENQRPGRHISDFVADTVRPSNDSSTKPSVVVHAPSEPHAQWLNQQPRCRRSVTNL